MVLIWVSDSWGAITYVSREWRQVTGHSLDSAQGSGWLDSVHPRDRATVMLAVQTSAKQHASLTIQFRLKRATGDFIWVVAGAVPSFGPPDRRFLGYLGSVTQTDAPRSEEVRVHIGSFDPPPPHPATQAHGTLDRIADHLLLAHSLMREDGGKSALPDVEQALVKIGAEIAKTGRHRQVTE